MYIYKKKIKKKINLSFYMPIYIYIKRKKPAWAVSRTNLVYPVCSKEHKYINDMIHALLPLTRFPHWVSSHIYIQSKPLSTMVLFLLTHT